MPVLISLLLTLSLSLGAGAAGPKDRITVKKGGSITVQDFDPKTELFLISVQGEAVGPLYVTAESLRSSIAFEGSAEDFMKQKAQMTGSIYEIKKPLPILHEHEVLKRVKKAVKDANK